MPTVRATNQEPLPAGRPAAGVAVPNPDRRKGERRASQPDVAGIVARWPLDFDDGVEAIVPQDPWVALVRESVADYRAGLADRASRYWDDNIRWRIPCETGLSGEWTGADQIFDFHRLLGRLTDETFRQRMIALEGNRGPFVEAHLRTTAERPGRSLDIPTMIVFELSGGRISCVTEMPGDRDAWRDFWAE